MLLYWQEGSHMELKDKLKQLRKAQGLTQAQLADAIFVSRSTVAKWEISNFTKNLRHLEFG